MQTIVLFGANGLIGSHLSSTLQSQGYAVITVSRHPTPQQLPLDFKSPVLRQALEEAYGVVNLAGAPIIGKRLTARYRQTIRESRSGLTQQLVSCLAELPHRPAVLINGSAIGYYGTHELTDAPYTETSPAGGGFWGNLSVEWEAAAQPAAALGIRTVLLRTGLILANNPYGTLAKLALPFRLGIGGPVGVASTWRSWIHINDEIGIILLALTDSTLSGPINATAPEPLRNSELAHQLGNQLHRPSWLNVPEMPLRAIFGDVCDVITRGKKVLPEKALAKGYQFNYPTFKLAINDLL